MSLIRGDNPGATEFEKGVFILDSPEIARPSFSHRVTPHCLTDPLGPIQDQGMVCLTPRIENARHRGDEGLTRDHSRVIRYFHPGETRLHPGRTVPDKRLQIGEDRIHDVVLRHPREVLFQVGRARAQTELFFDDPGQLGLVPESESSIGFTDFPPRELGRLQGHCHVVVVDRGKVRVILGEERPVVRGVLHPCPAARDRALPCVMGAWRRA